MDGFPFHTDLVVRFAETDAQGIAHNSVYLVWFEVARIDYLARYAHGYRHIQEQGYEALTIESHVRYVRPVVFDDRLAVHARVTDIRGARFTFEYAVTRAEELVADGFTRHAVVDAKTLRPARFPPWLAEAIAGAEGGG